MRVSILFFVERIPFRDFDEIKSSVVRAAHISSGDTIRPRRQNPGGFQEN